MNFEDYFFIFLFRKHLSQELDHFCKVSLSFLKLILGILDAGFKHFSSISSKNMYLVESISKILAAAFCLAAFFLSDFTIYEGSEKSYSVLNSFKTCTKVTLDKSLQGHCPDLQRNV